MEDMHLILKKILASYWYLTLKARNYHWNVTGSNFMAIHSLLEDHYSDYDSAVDLIAEKIRALGFKAIANYQDYSNLSCIKDGDETLSTNAMLEDLIASNNSLVDLLKQGVKIAESIEDAATADMLIARLEEHSKQIWMLSSSL